jgi:hypothetical protein
MLLLCLAYKDPQAHPKIGDERCTGDRKHLRGVCPDCGIDQEGMKDTAGEPENHAAPPKAKQSGHNEAHYFAPGRPLPECKGPILIQEKAVDCAQAVGQRTISQDHGSTGGGKQQQQEIQDQQVHQGIQPANQAKPEHLPEQTGPARDMPGVGVLFAVEWLNRVEYFSRLPVVEFRSIYHKHILSITCVATRLFSRFYELIADRLACRASSVAGDNVKGIGRGCEISHALCLLIW